MSRIKTTTVVLLVGLALSMVAASPAAAGWFIEGEELPAGSKATLATTAVVDSTLTLKTGAGAATPIDITCTGGTAKALLECLSK